MSRKNSLKICPLKIAFGPKKYHLLFWLLCWPQDNSSCRPLPYYQPGRLGSKPPQPTFGVVTTPPTVSHTEWFHGVSQWLPDKAREVPSCVDRHPSPSPLCKRRRRNELGKLGKLQLILFQDPFCQQLRLSLAKKIPKNFSPTRPASWGIIPGSGDVLVRTRSTSDPNVPKSCAMHKTTLLQS